MKPEQFIREFGLGKAREVVEGAPDWATVYDFEIEDYYRSSVVTNKDVLISDLKRLVESLETIESWGGIESCKEIVHRATSNQVPPEKSFARKLQMDVANYESIYGGGDDL